jgi:hypothetical protein
MAITISVGLLTLIGLIAGGGLGAIAEFMIWIMLVIAAIAVLVGVANLLVVHLGRIFRGARGAMYSLALVLALVGVIVARAIELAQTDEYPVAGTGKITGPLFEVLQLSVETALAGMLAFFLVFGALRMMRRHVSASSVLFIVILVVVMLGWQPLPIFGDLFGRVRDWLVTVPATGGTRGILIGVALGALTVGIRVLIGRDQPYQG